jgi:hypothetical protein
MFHYIILLFHSFPTIPSSITLPLIVVTILLLDGPHFWPLDLLLSFHCTAFSFHSIPTIPSSIPLPLVCTYDCCDHPPVGRSAFFVLMIPFPCNPHPHSIPSHCHAHCIPFLFYCLLCTPLIVVLILL